VAELVFAAAVSHTAQMVRSLDLLTEQQRGSVLGALSRLRDELRESDPDAVLMFGGDHYNSFFLDNMPSICIGLGSSTETWGDGGVPKYEVPLHDALGGELTDGLLERGFDLSTSRRMRLDHGFACPLHYLVPEMKRPLVPILINTIAPPLAPPMRAYQLGRAVGELLRASRAAKRVAVIGTGGLSHSLPIPHPDEATTPAEKAVRAQMIDGREDPSQLTKLLIERVKQVSDSGAVRFNEAFDREVIDQLCNGRAKDLATRTSAWIAEHGGNGGQEIRNWLAVAGTVDDCPAELVSYEAIQRWLSGIAFMRWQLG